MTNRSFRDPGSAVGDRLAALARLSAPVLLVLGIVLLPGTGLPGADRLAAQEEGEFDDQRVVIVHEEPRHRLVVDAGDIKVLDVQIQPGDTTLPHRHVSPIMYTFVSFGDGPANGRVDSRTDYLEEPLTHRVSNEGPHLFQIIAIAHYGEGSEDLTAHRPDGIEKEPQLENPWFRSYRFELEPGEETAVHRHRNPVVIVQVTEGEAEVVRDDGFGDQLHGLGKWAWREAEGTYRLRNAGDAPVAVVVNEARKGG